MKILLTTPDLDETKQIGGIITVVNTIISVTNVQYDIFVRSPMAGQRNLYGKVKWIAKISAYVKLCLSGKYNLIHVHTAMNTSALIRDAVWVFIGKLLGAKILLHVHGGKYLFEKPNSKMVNSLIKRMCFASRALIVLSEKEKKSIQTLYPVNVTVHVLENSINTSTIPIAFQIEKEWKKKSPLRLIFIGRITSSKGVQDIVQALIQLNMITTEFVFDLYGDGDLKNYVIQELMPVLEERFKYHGIVSGNAKWEGLQNADIFLLPSRYGEGLPMALLEAMFMGKIVLTTDDASMGLVVKHSVNGFIVKKYSPDDILNTVLKIAQFSEKQRKSVTDAARLMIQESYSVHPYIAKLEAIYENL